VLVVKLRFHGDVLLRRPYSLQSKRRHPELDRRADISGSLDMLSFHPDIAEIHCIDRSWKEIGAATHPACRPCLVRGCGEERAAGCLLATEVDTVCAACQSSTAVEPNR
jgi:heptosyltransferase-3